MYEGMPVPRPGSDPRRVFPRALACEEISAPGIWRTDDNCEAREADALCEASILGPVDALAQAPHEAQEEHRSGDEVLSDMEYGRVADPKL